MPAPKPKKVKVRSLKEMELVRQFGSGVQRMCGCKSTDRKRCKQTIVFGGDFANPKSGNGKHADVDLGLPLNMEEENILLKQHNEALREYRSTTVFEVPELRKRAAVFETRKKGLDEIVQNRIKDARKIQETVHKTVLDRWPKLPQTNRTINHLVEELCGGNLVSIGPHQLQKYVSRSLVASAMYDLWPMLAPEHRTIDHIVDHLCDGQSFWTYSGMNKITKLSLRKHASYVHPFFLKPH